jgi:hypothetical protein
MPVSLFPLHSIPVEDAVGRIWTGACHAVFDYDRPILTPTLKMKWPAVIARNSNLKIKGKVKLRRESLYYRDHGMCVYCERPLTINTTTYDHVLPRARGGKHAWENVVSACRSCNGRKGSNAPVGEWRPKRKPFEPSYYDLLAKRKLFPIVVPDESWIHFLDDWKAEIIIA